MPMEKNSKLEVGTVKIHKDVIASIAQITPPGIKSRRREIKVEFSKNDEIILNVPLTSKYGCNISEVAENAEVKIRQALEKMIDKTPRDIRISIQAIEKA